MKSITLRSGHTVPQLGLGTWELEGAVCRQSVAEAIEMGYRHIDTAFAYANHREVGAGISDSGIARNELFVTTKVGIGQGSRSQVIEQGKKLRDELMLDYVDLFLIHWPTKKTPFAETLDAMGVLVDRGVVRSIGVSNFNKEIVAEADGVSPHPIVTNQVEFHPLLFQKELMESCHNRDIWITAYSPLARGQVMSNGVLSSVGSAHGVSAAEASIAWIIAKGIIVIPKASSVKHLKSNLAAADLELTPDEIASIDSIEEHRRVINAEWKHYPF